MTGPREYGPLCAEFYDLTKPVDGVYPDVPFYRSVLRQTNGTILEAAAGTGRLLIPLLQDGLEVEGLDSSQPMLAYCRRNCADYGLSPSLQLGRLESMAAHETYAAVVLAFGSLMLLNTDEALKAMACIWKALTPGGRFYFDLDVPRIPEQADGVMRRIQRVHCPENETYIDLWSATEYDMICHLERNRLRYEKFQNDQQIATEEQDFTLRWYGVDEPCTMLRLAGFDQIETCGDYDPQLRSESARDWMCFQARRPLR